MLLFRNSIFLYFIEIIIILIGIYVFVSGYILKVMVYILIYGFLRNCILIDKKKLIRFKRIWI